ncbi:MAG: type IV pilus secretin PilQ [Alteromonadaceae bacterium]|nr:type IV pilus secretin PilQ [Alteromonadaceae bacterium]
MFSRSTLWLKLLIGLIMCLSLVANAQQTPQLIDANAMPNSEASGELIDIKFRKTLQGGAITTFEFSMEDYQLVIAKSGLALQITMPGMNVAQDQLVALDVTDFSTPVVAIETFQESDHARIVFEAKEEFVYQHEKMGNKLRVTLQSNVQAEVEKFKAQFSGDPISLDFQDVPVRQVLQIIAQVNGFNLVTTDTVTGNVTISLTDVPWDQALSMILKIKGLDKRLEGNILLIAPTEELAARETQLLQTQQQVADLAPLVSEHVQINYAKAADLATILKSTDGGILSAKGTTTVDERTNTLIIRDTQKSIDSALELIRILDIPIRQVLIESRMVTVRDGVDEQLGIRWGFSDQQDSDGVSGTLEGADTIAGGTVPVIADRLNVNLPVNNPAGSIGISVARLIDGTILDLELSALESENKGEIIASPRITVANQHEAYIEQGTEIPYVQATSSGATSVEFKKAVLSMKVTPHITPDNRVILDLVVTQDTRGETVSTPTGPAVAIDTQEINTQVLVENGETIVLGGIFQQTISDANTQVPLFGDLPVVGRLFQNTQKINDKRELLIFVTPKILTEAL